MRHQILEEDSAPTHGRAAIFLFGNRQYNACWELRLHQYATESRTEVTRSIVREGSHATDLTQIIDELREALSDAPDVGLITTNGVFLCFERVFAEVWPLLSVCHLVQGPLEFPDEAGAQLMHIVSLVTGGRCERCQAKSEVAV